MPHGNPPSDHVPGGGHGRARRFVLDGVARMRERPIQDLVDGLVQLGVDAKCSLGTGCPPVEVNAQGLPSGKVRTWGGWWRRWGRRWVLCGTQDTLGIAEGRACRLRVSCEYLGCWEILLSLAVAGACVQGV